MDIERLELRSKVSKPIVVITVQCVSDKNDDVSSATIKMYGDNWWLVNFATAANYRKIGLGTEVMSQVVAWWDAYMQGRPLYFQALPYTNRPLDVQDLIAFCERFGFRETETPGILVRKGAM